MPPAHANTRPAVPLCTGLLLGLLLAPQSTFVSACLSWVAALSGTAYVLVYRRWVLAASFLGFFAMLAFGSWYGDNDRSRSLNRLTDWLPAIGESAEFDLRGTLIVAPEPAGDGEHLLLIDGHPETRLDAPRRRIRLRIRESPQIPTARLNELRAGDEVRAWCRIYRPRILGHPGTGTPDAYATVKSARLVTRIVRGKASLARFLDDLKAQCRDDLTRITSGEPSTRALLGALLLGDRADLPPDVRRELRDAGLLHLVAISGLHIGLLMMSLVWALRRLRCPPVLILLIALGLMIPFALFVGVRPSVLRAVIGCAVILYARAIGRGGDPVNLLAAMAAALLLIEPSLAAAPGFQLTFAATAGILLLVPRLQASLPLPTYVSFVSTPLAISAAAYIVTAPLVAWHFGRVAPISLVSNLPCVPLLALALCGGYGAMIFSSLPLVGEWAGWVAVSASQGLLHVARLAEALDSGAFVVPRPSLELIAIYFLTLVLAIRGDPGSTWSRRISKPAFMVALLWLQLGPPPAHRPGLAVSVIDVGQGQAILMRSPEGRLYLADAGGSFNPRFDPGEQIVVPLIVNGGDRRLEAVFISHEHIDHAGGVFAILRELEVGALWLGAGSHRSALARQLADLAREQGSAVVLAERGGRVSGAGMPIEVLGPPRRSTCNSVNDRSVSLRVGTAPHRLLIPGDLETCGEQELLESSQSLRSEVLVVSHHGSKEGTSAAFLERVRPTVAVISVGKGNPFGHPAPEIIARLRLTGSTVWRTDRHGLLRLFIEGNRWRLSTFHDTDRHRDEGQCEDHDQQAGHDRSQWTQRSCFVDQSWMAVPHPEQNGEPDQIRRELAQMKSLVDDEHPHAK